MTHEGLTSASGLLPPGTQDPIVRPEMLSHEAVSLLENLDVDAHAEEIGHTRLGPAGKATALLVALGIKPAGVTDYYAIPPHSPGESPQALVDSSDEYTDILHKLGLHTATVVQYIEAKPDPLSPDEQRSLGIRSVYMAKTDQALDELTSATRKGDRRGIGLALGYPPSSVESFISGRRVWPEDVEGVDAAVLAFNFFLLSPDNTNQEVA